MKKRGLWWIFGPVVVAFVLIFALFLAPFSLNHITHKNIRDASVSFSKNTFKGEAIKTAALVIILNAMCLFSGQVSYYVWIPCTLQCWLQSIIETINLSY